MAGHVRHVGTSRTGCALCRTMSDMGTDRGVDARMAHAATPTASSDATIEFADTDIVLGIASEEAGRWHELLSRLAK